MVCVGVEGEWFDLKEGPFLGMGWEYFMADGVLAGLRRSC